MDSKRSQLLIKYMDALKEKYPNEDSKWIRRQAEARLTKKLGIEPGSESFVAKEIPATPKAENPPPVTRLKKTTSGYNLTTTFSELIFAVLAVGTFAYWAFVQSQHLLIEGSGGVKSAIQKSQLLNESRNIMLWFGLFVILLFICHGIRAIVDAVNRINVNQHM